MKESKEFVDFWSGITLTPSIHGENCQGNGKHTEKECCCDECDYYLECFPDWRQIAASDEHLRK